MHSKTKQELKEKNAAFFYLRSTGLATTSLSSILRYIARIISLTKSSSPSLGIVGGVLSAIGFLSSTVANVFDPTASKSSRVLSVALLGATIVGAVPLFALGTIFPAMWVYLGAGMMGFGVLSASYSLFNNLRKQKTLEKNYLDTPEGYIAYLKDKRKEKYEALLDVPLEDKHTRATLVFKLFKTDQKIAYGQQHGADKLLEKAITRKQTRTLGSSIDVGTSVIGLIVGVCGLVLGVAAWPIGPILVGISFAAFAISLCKSSIEFYRKVNKNNNLVKEMLSHDRYLSLIDASRNNTNSLEESDSLAPHQQPYNENEQEREIAPTPAEAYGHKEQHTKLFPATSEESATQAPDQTQEPLPPRSCI